MNKPSASLLIVVLASCSLAFGQTPSQWIDAHNKYRHSLLGFDGNPTSSPDLIWSDALAKDAQDWANKNAAAGKSTHRPNSGSSTHADARPWGENLAWGSSSTFDGLAGLMAWYDEKPFFVPASSTCTANNVCGHFTQVVSQLSKEVGCATASGADLSVYVVCSYSPHGNTQQDGAYSELYKNQRPPVPGGAVFGNLKGIGLDLRFNDCLQMQATAMLAAPPAKPGVPSDLVPSCGFSKVRAYDTGLGASGFTGTADRAGAALTNLIFPGQVLGLNGGIAAGVTPLRSVLITGE
jgi:pathogenesis-related protein 1